MPISSNNLFDSRQRIIKNFCVHILAVLVNYKLNTNKPSINFLLCQTRVSSYRKIYCIIFNDTYLML